MMKDKLWEFSDKSGSFKSGSANKIKNLYFPLANRSLMSSVSPDLHGDIKANQNSFLLTPVSRQDLTDLKASRNFWIYINKDKVWSATGVSKDASNTKKDKYNLEAGLLWHKISRENKDIGLRAEILSFVPKQEPIEIMLLKITNISSRKIKFVPTAAIPIYGRGANNLRDHRQVTSLLQRITLDKFGIIVQPTLLFDENGHRPNKTMYFTLGWDERFTAPQYLYPTQEMFCGEGGDLEAPISVLNNLLPQNKHIQGKETMGALRFRSKVLAPRKSWSYIIVMGISEDKAEIKEIINKLKTLDKVQKSFQDTSNHWLKGIQRIKLSTGDYEFDNWFRWVSIQPRLREIFGCSFLPDFDYGRGGRGWRDLWQDCLGLILNNPQEVRSTLINNFSGVRIDGSNATLIGKSKSEFTPLETKGKRQKAKMSLTGFKSDRNNISRVWMDHGTWPLLTLDLYLNETGDFNILFKQTSYFRNHEVCRTRAIDFNWEHAYGKKLKTKSGKIYQGTILEHLLVENLVQFFNVGDHNYIRLEGGDWNDGLDMAEEFGESVAFTAMYANNLGVLSGLLLKTGKKKIMIGGEIKLLLAKIDYGDIKGKERILHNYFERTKSEVSGKKVSIDVLALASDLKSKSDLIIEHIRKKEWLRSGFFNGYYDNKKQRVEGFRLGRLRMMLSSQVFLITGGVANDLQVKQIIKSVDKYLYNRNLKGYQLNTDFKQEQHDLGRAFSYIYGDKENGAFFNHMIVMYAYALYKRNFIKQGWRVLSSIYKMALNTPQSKIYPCLPEYFNLQGQGMYSYLTGSASWFVLTMLNGVFGVRGEDGNLLVEPKISFEQFKGTSIISIERVFTARKFRINFSKSRRSKNKEYKIIKASLNSQNLPLVQDKRIVISRNRIMKLPRDKIHTLEVVLG
ncbi:MAG: cellobiose phosphorylase [Candidatus Omnitrophota bacterium]